MIYGFYKNVECFLNSMVGVELTELKFACVRIRASNYYADGGGVGNSSPLAIIGLSLDKKRIFL